jgi:hypothetical protein
LGKDNKADEGKESKTKRYALSLLVPLKVRYSQALILGKPLGYFGQQDGLMPINIPTK